MFAPFNKLLHLFPIFVPTFKEILCGSRLMHSSAHKMVCNKLDLAVKLVLVRTSLQKRSLNFTWSHR